MNGDAAFVYRPAVHDGEIEGEPRHRRQVDVEQQGVPAPRPRATRTRLALPAADHAKAVRESERSNTRRSGASSVHHQEWCAARRS